VPSRLPPERIDRAMVGGARYALHSPDIRTSLARVFAFGLMTASGTALAPLVAKDILQGDAATFGILLGAGGVGAVMGALFVSEIRERFPIETAIRVFAIGTGAALIAIGTIPSLPVTIASFAVIGACNTLTVALLNVSVQMSAPRWVTARALSLFSSAITAGFGLGAWAWGVVAGLEGIAFALTASGFAAMTTVFLGFVLPLRRDTDTDGDTVDIGHEPEAALKVSLRSGPVVVEIEYDVDPERARDFYDLMMKIQRARKRIGGFDWSISRDIENPAVWLERYSCPTWGDYLRMRDRYSAAEYDLQEEADTFNRSGHGRRVRRMLERPFGSVRWKADSPDPQQETVTFIGP
jgi:hypothetical protein